MDQLFTVRPVTQLDPQDALPTVVNHRVVADVVEAGELQPVIGGSFPMDRASEAHALVDTGHKRGSAVMTMI